MAGSPARTATALVLRLLTSAVMRYRRRTLAALGLVVLAKLTTVAVPLALKGIVDRLGGAEPVLVLPVFLLLGYAILRFLGTFFGELRDIIFVRVTQNTVSGFLLRAFEHLHRLSVRFHATRRTGGVTRDVERGTAGVGFLLGVALFTVLPTLVEIGAVVLILSVSYSLWFTAIIFATFVLYGAFTVTFTERRAIYQRALNELDSSANSRLVDSLLNYETVKYYTNERFERERFSGILGQWIEVGVDNQKALFLLHIGQSGIIAVGVAVVMLFAAQNVVGGSMTVGDLVLVNAYVIQVCLPLNSLGFVFRQARDAIVNSEKMFRMLEEKPEIEDAPDTPELAVSRGEVRFEKVDFGYEASRQILWDVSFTIAPGGTVAVVGGSGSGKSTLARLLFRFYDVGAGRIAIDGQDVRGVSQRSLRAAVGIVPQDTILFNDTIAYNIAYGRRGATIAEVIDAAKAAHVHDFIMGLPEQYETQVGERGVKLSGGEKQRIAIARAILKNPPILVFDEATSALDTRAERAIQDELDRLAAERTTLVIAHRLSTVVDADEILVLEHGRVVERGTHDQLLRSKGLYAQMWQLQRQQQALEQAEVGSAMQPVDLVAIVSGIVEGLRPLVAARGVGFHSTIAVEAALVTGEPSRLQQAVWSLGERAIAATPAGGHVELSLRRAAGWARIAVSHDVIRPDSAEVAGAVGEGALDLDRVRAIVEQHGGRLEVLAPPGGTGTALSFPLRAVIETAPPPAPALSGGSSAVALPRPSISGVAVLVVGDKPEVRAQVEGVLHGHGALTRGYATAVAALQWLRSLPRADWPDIMVCDLALDEKDGAELVHQLRGIEAQRELGPAERLPAVAISADASSEHRMRALLAGFQVHLPKPVDADELVAVIANLAGRRTHEPASARDEDLPPGGSP